MPYVTADDGAEIFYKDWGTGTPVVLSHGWPLNADAWEAAALFLANNGHRAIAHDRRGHGRSSQTWHGNEMDTYADDLATLMDTLDLRERHPGRALHRRRRGRALPRPARKRPGREGGAGVCGPATDATHRRQSRRAADREFDQIRAGEPADRSQLYRDLADGPFFGHNRNNDISQGYRDAFWLQSMACGHRGAYECIAAFSATDFRPDLAAVDVPTLVIHGDDDQIVPFDIGGKRSARAGRGRELKVYPGGAHGLPDTDGTAARRPARVHRRLQPEQGEEQSMNDARPDTVVLVHGLWMTPRSWENWVDPLSGQGADRARPGLPRLRGRGGDATREPETIANHTVAETVDHLAGVVGASTAADHHGPLVRRHAHPAAARPRPRAQPGWPSTRRPPRASG